MAGSGHLPLYFFTLSVSVVCTSESASLGHPPPLPRHTTIPQGSGLHVALELLHLILKLLEGRVLSCSHFAECYLGLTWVLYWIFLIVSSCKQSLVSQEAVKYAEPLSQMEMIQFKCLNFNLICVKTGVYASGYQIPHLSLLCCFGLYNAPYINSTVGFVHIFVLLLLWYDNNYDIKLIYSFSLGLKQIRTKHVNAC